MEEMNNMTVDSVGAAGTEGQAGAQGQENGQGQPKKYTDADVDKIIARKIAAERRRAAKQAEEEQQESDLQHREKELAKRELRADARDELTEKGLPLCVADILNYDSKEGYGQSMEAVLAVVDELRKAWELERATGTTPRMYRNDGDPLSQAVRDAFRP